MGNCIQQQRGVTWLDDEEDWVSAESEDSRHGKEKASEMAGDVKKLGDKGQLPSTEVKIKISKKQLEELLAKGLPIQQVLTGLISLGEAGLQDHGRHWMPALQSIAEVSE